MVVSLKMGNLISHSRAPLFEQCMTFVERDGAPFYSPGHKGGRTFPASFRDRIAALDLNNLPDTDTLHCPTSGILDAQTLLADAYGARHSFFLVGGSTSGNIAAMLSALSPGDEILVQRNAHKSVIAGIVHVGAVPVWLAPSLDEDFGLALGLAADKVDAAFTAHPKARALFVLSPTYFGTVPDLAALAEVCRRHGRLLLVDQAHGAHFHFHPELPVAAEDIGADAVVQSIHKTLSGLSQAAVLHLCTDRLDVARVQEVLQLLQTTSPSFPVMASIDLARREMALDGERLLTEALGLARRARAELAAIAGVVVLGPERTTGARSGFFALDETKITIRVDGVTGYEVQRLLNEQHGVQPELGGTSHVLFILTIGNTDRDVDRMVAGVRAIAASRQATPSRDASPAPHAWALRAVQPDVVMTPREAFYARAQTVDFFAAEGRVCAEVVTPYPPGIPVLMPGERITRALLDELARVREARCPISASDPTLVKMRVVA